MAKVFVELEEIIALKEYKNFKIRICLEKSVAMGEEDEAIEELGEQVRKSVKSQARKLLKTICSDNLAGGAKRQWAYKTSRRKKNGEKGS